MFELILSRLFPPSFGGPVVYQSFEDEFDPFSSLDGEDGVGEVRVKKYRDGIERVRKEGI